MATCTLQTQCMGCTVMQSHSVISLSLCVCVMCRVLTRKAKLQMDNHIWTLHNQTRSKVFSSDPHKLVQLLELFATVRVCLHVAVVSLATEA